MTNQTPRGTRGGETGRRVPMRLWLGAAFAGVSLITAASVYVFVDDSSGRTLQSQSGDLAVGKTSSLADDLGKVDKLHAANVLALSNTGNFEVWALNRHGNAFAPGQDLAAPGRRPGQVGGASRRPRQSPLPRELARERHGRRGTGFRQP